MNVFSLQGLDGATMDTVLIVGLKIIFVTTLLIGPVSESGSPCLSFATRTAALPGLCQHG